VFRGGYAVFRGDYRCLEGTIERLDVFIGV